MKRMIVFLGIASCLIALSCEKFKPSTKKAKPLAPASQPAALGTASSVPPTGAQPSDTASPVPADASQTLAKIDGESITDAQVTERVKSQLKKYESQIFDIKMGGLTDLIEEKLLEKEAKKRNVSADELIKKEITDKVEEPSTQEIQTYFTMMKGRFKDQSLEEAKPSLIRQIKATRERTLYGDFMAKLRKESKVEVLMQRPRVEVSVDDDPSKGKKGAPVTIIEFADFQCPFCKRVSPTRDKILETYKDKIYWVFRDFPLSFHKQAPKAAQAANCAGEQGKYWQYFNMLFENQQNIQADDLKSHAKKLALNEKKFNECFDSDKMAEEIEKDIQDGMAAGVSGTPAFFINGIFFSGAQPFERFQEIIDEELMRAEK